MAVEATPHSIERAANTTSTSRRPPAALHGSSWPLQRALQWSFQDEGRRVGFHAELGSRGTHAAEVLVSRGRRMASSAGLLPGMPSAASLHAVELSPARRLDAFHCIVVVMHGCVPPPGTQSREGGGGQASDTGSHKRLSESQAPCHLHILRRRSVCGLEGRCSSTSCSQFTLAARQSSLKFLHLTQRAGQQGFTGGPSRSACRHPQSAAVAPCL